jgi:hypothetical protein
MLSSSATAAKDIRPRMNILSLAALAFSLFLNVALAFYASAPFNRRGVFTFILASKGRLLRCKL